MKTTKSTEDTKANDKNEGSGFGAATCSPRYFDDGLLPKHGDVVKWVSNDEEWQVNAQDDLDNPGTSLTVKEWQEDVIFIRRSEGKRRCPACDGEGEFLAYSVEENYFACQTCKGTGVVNHTTAIVESKKENRMLKGETE